MKKRNCDAIIQSIITKIACEKKKNANENHLPILPKFHKLPNLKRKGKQ